MFTKIPEAQWLIWFNRPTTLAILLWRLLIDGLLLVKVSNKKSSALRTITCIFGVKMFYQEESLMVLKQFRLMMMKWRKIQKNTLYYVQEGEGFRTHPLFDLFFLCKLNNEQKDTLVMIDISGGGIQVAEQKLKKISKWIKKQKLEKFGLKGFVLAPGARMKNKKDALGNYWSRRSSRTFVWIATNLSIVFR